MLFHHFIHLAWHSCLLWAFVLTPLLGPSQINILNNALQEQNLILTDDCYIQNLDNGNAALRRNDYKSALAFFKAAKQCPETQSNLRRQSDLDMRINRCKELLTNAPSLAALPSETTSRNKGKQGTTQANRTPLPEKSNARKEFPIKASLLSDTLDDCFYRMENEAERAFRLKYWEDAAALFRAAKNCSNANQENRRKMSQRILDCRNAAEAELFAKQQEAERRARHAIASKLANDSEKLLRHTDRSLAYRLADFANQYIAPDDNPDCIQAILDAWYYQPTEISKHRYDELYRPAFCYELADNLGEGVRLKFERKRGGKHWLWVFVPQNNELTAWEFPSMTAVQTINLGDNSKVRGFDVSPNGSILLYGDNFLEVRKGGQNHRVQVPKVTLWCFSERGDELFFENSTEKTIYLLSLTDLEYRNTKRGVRSNELAWAPNMERPYVTGIEPGLLAISYDAGEFWLGYSNRIEILSKSESGKPWKRQATIRFEEMELPQQLSPDAVHMHLSPKNKFAVLAFANKAKVIDFSNKNNVLSRNYDDQIPLATLSKQGHIACINNSNYEQQGFWIINAFNGDTLLRQRLSNFYNFDNFSGSFSDDGHWVAAANSAGNVKAWNLTDAPTIKKYDMPAVDEKLPQFSASAKYFWLYSKDTLFTYSTDDLTLPYRTTPSPIAQWIGASDDWLLTQVSPQNIELQKLDNSKKITLPCPNEDGMTRHYAFDVSGEKFVAYMTSWNTIEVRSLHDGVLLDQKTFEGGEIGHLKAMPQDALLVVQHNPFGESAIGQSSVKIWHPANHKEKTKALRMHNYEALFVAVDPRGHFAAFSNGSDIRVFDLTNTSNELVKIRQLYNENIRAITFRPNTRQLAAAYEQGSIVFWDIKIGQPAFTLKIKPQDENTLFSMGWEVASIGFSNDGSELYIYEKDGKMLQYVIDPTRIRNEAQDAGRSLQSFEVAHIANYDLESAMKYPGNFERLAESGDAPLIRSFFQYYRWQAVESNNIDHVKAYSDKASYLYERLDPNTRAVWQGDLIFIFEDYAHKLILRGRLKEAHEILTLLQKKFSVRPTMLEANLALLKHDFKNASALYSKHLLTNEHDRQPTGLDTEWKISQMEYSMAQLRDYDMLDSAQIACYCGVVALSGISNNFCRETTVPKNNPYLSDLDVTAWEIYRLCQNNNDRLKTRLETLKNAYSKAEVLAQRSAEAGTPWRDKILLELGAHYYQYAKFEKNGPKAEALYRDAAGTIATYGPLKTLNDTMRLSLLTSIHLAWANHLLIADRVEEARLQYSKAIDAAEQLYNAAKGDTVQLYQYGEALWGNICLNAGHAYLLSGMPTEARKMYEQAGNYFIAYGLNSLYLGNIAVFENNEEQALLNYGGIFSAEQAAEALFMLDRLSARFSYPWIKAFMPKLRNGLRSKNLRLVSSETEYWFAQKKIEYFSATAQWDSAAVWSRASLQVAEKAREQANATSDWTIRWLNEHINLSYYQLLSHWDEPTHIASVIQLIQKAEQFLSNQTENFYYSNRNLLRLNLGHAYIVRNKNGDRQRAVEIYQDFLKTYTILGNTRDVLEKDLQDLRNVGAPIPNLPELDHIDPDE